MLVGNLHHAVDDCEIGLNSAMCSRCCLLLALTPLGAAKLLGPASQVAPAQGSPRNQANTSVVAESVHLTLLLAVEQVVVILHADELGPAVLLGAELHAGKLRGPHAACTNVAHLAGLDQVMQSLHGLFDRSVGVEAMDLQKIDVWRVQATERSLDGVEDGSA